MKASADKNTGAQLTSLDSGWLLVVGGGNLEGGPDGTWRTKAPVAQYLNQLAAHFDRCVWMAPRLHHPLGLTGRLDDNVVEIVPFDEDPLGFLKFMVSFALLCRGRPLALLFLPAIMPLLPLMPLARLLCRRMVIYLGTDYDGQLKRQRTRTRPG